MGCGGGGCARAGLDHDIVVEVEGDTCGVRHLTETDEVVLCEELLEQVDAVLGRGV